MSDSLVLPLAKALISRPSITPEDAGCQQMLAQRLQALGFLIENINAGGVSNLWARRGAQSPVLAFAGHTDVVPPGAEHLWLSEPFTPTERNGKLYGRGASDMKSSIAAFVAAVEEFVAKHPDHAGSIAFMITSDEEGPALHGTIEICRALAARNETIDYCIVGEPTSVDALGDTIKNGRRGSLSGRLTVHGKQGHVAYPHLAQNAIHLLAPALAELAAQAWDDGDADFPPTTFQASNLHAGAGVGNVVPGTAVLDFNLRFSPASSPESLTRRVSAILTRHDLKFDIEWALGAECYLTPPGTLSAAIRKAIKDETGLDATASTTGGTSDGRFIAKICPQVIEFGPVNASIHQINEHVLISALEPLKNIYRRTLENILRG